MSAKENEVIVFEKFKNFLLTKLLPFWGKINSPRFMIGVERFDRRADRLSHHHHSRAAAEGIIVAFEVLVLRIIAKVDRADLHFILFLRPAENARIERGKHFGKQCKNIDLHTLLLCLITVPRVLRRAAFC